MAAISSFFIQMNWFFDIVGASGWGLGLWIKQYLLAIFFTIFWQKIAENGRVWRSDGFQGVILYEQNWKTSPILGVLNSPLNRSKWMMKKKNWKLLFKAKFGLSLKQILATLWAVNGLNMVKSHLLIHGSNHQPDAPTISKSGQLNEKWKNGA